MLMRIKIWIEVERKCLLKANLTLSNLRNDYKSQFSYFNIFQMQKILKLNINNWNKEFSAHPINESNWHDPNIVQFDKNLFIELY